MNDGNTNFFNMMQQLCEYKYLPNPVINLAVVNDMYSGIKAPKINPRKTISSDMIKAIFRPNLSEMYPNTYEPISKADIVKVAVKNT